MAYQLPDSQVIRCAPPSPALSYVVIRAPAASLRASVTKRPSPSTGGASGTTRAYRPKPPLTVPLYERALVELGPLDRVLDAGCGAGAGSALWRAIIAKSSGSIEAQRPSASPDGSRRAPRSSPGDLSFPQAVGTVDGAVVIDVLGQAVHARRGADVAAQRSSCGKAALHCRGAGFGLPVFTGPRSARVLALFARRPC